MTERDPRWAVYDRRDNWARATRIRPNPDGPGWLCPECGAAATTFYGQPATFENGKYVEGTETSVCRACAQS